MVNILNKIKISIEKHLPSKFNIKIQHSTSIFNIQYSIFTSEYLCLGAL